MSINDLMALATIGMGGLSLLAIAYAATLWAFRKDHPENARQAREWLTAAAVMAIVAGGLLAGGILTGSIDLDAPPFLQQGNASRPASGVDCDGILRAQLMTNRDAIDPETINRMTYMARRNRTACSSDIWDPRLSDTRVDDSGRDHRPGSAAYGARSCFGTGVDQDGSPDGRNTRRRLSVGEQIVPAGLRNQGDAERRVQNRSGRDQDNNIIVYWGYQDEIHRPRDGARCWLYNSSTRSWHANY